MLNLTQKSPGLWIFYEFQLHSLHFLYETLFSIIHDKVIDKNIKVRRSCIIYPLRLCFWPINLINMFTYNFKRGIMQKILILTQLMIYMEYSFTFSDVLPSTYACFTAESNTYPFRIVQHVCIC